MPSSIPPPSGFQPAPAFPYTDTTPQYTDDEIDSFIKVHNETVYSQRNDRPAHEADRNGWREAIVSILNLWRQKHRDGETQEIDSFAVGPIRDRGRDDNTGGRFKGFSAEYWYGEACRHARRAEFLRDNWPGSEGAEARKRMMDERAERGRRTGEASAIHTRHGTYISITAETRAAVVRLAAIPTSELAPFLTDFDTEQLNILLQKMRTAYRDAQPAMGHTERSRMAMRALIHHFTEQITAKPASASAAEPESLWGDLDSLFKMCGGHPGYRHHGTRTGRIPAKGGPNESNVPKRTVSVTTDEEEALERYRAERDRMKPPEALPSDPLPG